MSIIQYNGFCTHRHLIYFWYTTNINRALFKGRRRRDNMRNPLVKHHDYTPTQQHVIAQFSRRDRFAVIGGPGTGKTIVALEGFNQMLAKEAASRVLFIVFNKALKAFLKRYVAYHDDKKIPVYTWHSWLPTYCMRTFNIDFETFSERYQSEPYKFDFAKIQADLKNVKNRYQYYYVFIDEAQDIPTEVLDILSLVSVKLFVFFDDNQKFTPELLETHAPFSDVEQTSILHHLNVEEAFYDLTENFRNTASIERVAKLYDQNTMINHITLKRTTVKRTGSLPVLLDVDSPQKLVDYVVNEYLRDPQKSIAVLVSKMPDHKKILDHYRSLFLDDERILDHHLYIHQSNNEANLNFSGIFLMTYQISKGLEFDHVYLVELNHENFVFDHYHKNAFYVSITRAESQLTFAYDAKKPNSQVIDVALKHASYFRRVSLSKGAEDNE